MAVSQLQEATREELIARCAVGWQILQRVLSDVGLTIDTAIGQELRQLLSQVIEACHSELSKELAKALPAGLMRFNERFLDDEASAQNARYEATVDLFVERLRSQAAPQATNSAPIFNFHAPVGAVMAGANAVANVVQNFTGPESAQLASALHQVKTALVTEGGAIADSRDQVLALIEETTTELAQPRPNGLRVKQLAIGVAMAIQTAASLAPAYAVLKTALSLVGIAVP